MLLTNKWFIHVPVCLQTFADADRRQWQGMEDEWEKEKEQILNSLLGSGQDILELPLQNEVINY